MPFQYQIARSSRTVFVVATDPISYRGWEQTTLASLNDPDFETGYSFLIDTRNLNSLASPEEIRKSITFLAEQKARLGRSDWAVVVSSPAAYGMARMAQILAEPVGIRMMVFKDINEAQEWLSG